MGVIVFCGHGTYLPKVDKPNKQSEALVPFDSALGNFEHYIRDDEIKKMLEESATSNNITLIFDCCYASDATRGPGAASSAVV